MCASNQATAVRCHSAAFLGGDVAESGEGLGFMKNKLSRYLRHPAIIPKATLLGWATYKSNETVLNGYKGWYYSIKYDGWSAIWTGTKLVTANGRQTITTMPEKMQNALLSVQYPLVGELVLMSRQRGQPVRDTTQRNDFRPLCVVTEPQMWLHATK